MIKTGAVYGMSDSLDPYVTAAILAKAESYDSDLWITFGEKTIILSSLIGLLSLKLKRGTEITVTAEGPDEEAAAAGMKALVEAPYNK